MAGKPRRYPVVLHADRLAELLSNANARAIAFDPRGGREVPLPELLERLAPTVDTGTFDEIESSAAAEIAFEAARRMGHGSAPIEFVDHDDPFWLEVFDLTDTHQCFVGVAVPSADHVGSGQIRSVPTPRQAVYTVDESGIVRSVSHEFERALGWPTHRRVGRTEESIVHPDDWADHCDAHRDVLEQSATTIRGFRRFLRSDGSWSWCEVNSVLRADTVATRVEHQLAESSAADSAERDAIADALAVAATQQPNDHDVAESA